MMIPMDLELRNSARSALAKALEEYWNDVEANPYKVVYAIADFARALARDETVRRITNAGLYESMVNAVERVVNERDALREEVKALKTIMTTPVAISPPERPWGIWFISPVSGVGSWLPDYSSGEFESLAFSNEKEAMSFIANNGECQGPNQWCYSAMRFVTSQSRENQG